MHIYMIYLNSLISNIVYNKLHKDMNLSSLLFVKNETLPKKQKAKK